MKALGNTVFLTIAIAVVAGGYIGYRYWEVYDPGTITFEDRNRLPPMTCSFHYAGFSDSARGHIYTYQGKIRYDYSIIVGGKSIEAHVLVDPDDRMYIWQHDADRGLKTATSESKVDVMRHPISSTDCQPWWFPDISLLMLPADVDFLEQ